MNIPTELSLSTNTNSLTPRQGDWFYGSQHSVTLKSDKAFVQGRDYILTFKFAGKREEDPLYAVEFTGNGEKEITLSANLNLDALDDAYGGKSDPVPLDLDIWDLELWGVLGLGTIQVKRPVYVPGDVPPAVMPDSGGQDDHTILQVLEGVLSWVGRDGWLGTVLAKIRALGILGSAGQKIVVNAGGDGVEWGDETDPVFNAHEASSFEEGDKAKLDDIQAEAQVNVQSDWGQADNAVDDYIKNKPEIPDVNIVSTYSFRSPSAVDPLHFQLEISDLMDFSNIIVSVDSTVSQDNWYIFTGSIFELLPATGMEPGYHGLPVSYSSDTALIYRDLLYFIRYRATSDGGSTWSDWLGDMKKW